MKTGILRYYGLFVAASSSWVICSRSFEEMCRLNLQIYESIHGLTTLKMTAVVPSKHQEGTAQPYGAATENTCCLSTTDCNQ
jgi:hypothetical protein